MRKLLVVVALTLAACNTVPQQGQTPAQTVFAAKQAYAVALTAAVKYKQLPACETKVAPCKDPKLVKQMQAADDKAWPILDRAEAGARNGSVSQIVADEAMNAVNEFSKLTEGK